MKLKRLLTHLPLVAALFLMGCSYGCDSSNKLEPVYEEESEEALSDEAFEESVDIDEEVLDADIVEEEPVIPPESESKNFREEGLGEEESSYEEPQERMDEGEESEEESVQDDVPPDTAEDPELPPDEDPVEEDYESEEEEYIDDGETYEDDYPG